MSDHTTRLSSQVKTCTKCGKTKLATTEFFYSGKDGKHGLLPECKMCRAERQRAYKAANKEKIAEHHRAWRAANKERVADRLRAYRAANAEKIRARNFGRRARKANAEGKYTVADTELQYKRQKGRCYWCSTKVGKSYHADHIVPLSRGGSNRPENIVIACPSCNTSRQNKLPHEWIQGGRLL